MPDPASYLTSIINQPWARDGRHCWRLVCEVQRDLFGRELPGVIDEAPAGSEGRKIKAGMFGAHEERAKWQESPPVHGAVVLMRQQAARPEMLIHAGVYFDFDGGGVLHSNAPHGVVFDSLPELRVLRRWIPTFFIPRA